MHGHSIFRRGAVHYSGKCAPDRKKTKRMVRWRASAGALLLHLLPTMFVQLQPLPKGLKACLLLAD